VSSITERHLLDHVQARCDLGRHGRNSTVPWTSRQYSIGLTSHITAPTYRGPHVLLRYGLQIDDLYLNSLIAARHNMHVQLYGQLAFSLVRLDNYSHRALMQSATFRALISSMFFGALPLFQVVYLSICMYHCSQTTANRLLHPKATRTIIRKRRLARNRVAYNTLRCYLLLVHVINICRRLIRSTVHYFNNLYKRKQYKA
jgi:hypothetical protein